MPKLTSSKSTSTSKSRRGTSSAPAPSQHSSRSRLTTPARWVEPRELTRDEVCDLKEQLLRLRDEHLNHVSGFRSEGLSPGGLRGDEGDLASGEIDLNLQIRIKERAAQMLPKIDRALSRIEEGRFGLCEVCEEPIGLERLRARPVTSLCLACKEEQEQRERLEPVHA